MCANYLERSEKLINKGNTMAERMNADLIVLTILTAPTEDLRREQSNDTETVGDLQKIRCKARIGTPE